ncbi:MAG: N-acetylmuramoyl-L-alanine amidase [Lachnospiraceae bacterium]|nr:N-acetylmuramoyl-L-alanine amidase [Lachnospiraceae bacterium]
MTNTIILDAGHGGMDLGAAFNGRAEKEDTLALVLAVGEILGSFEDIDVIYTRDQDYYISPSTRADIANEADADYFISIHRNSTPVPDTYSGVESLVYQNAGAAGRIASNIAGQLEAIGFQDLGITERPNLTVLKNTAMPAVLVEIGYINTAADNIFFDDNFDAIARAIADGILESLGE